MEGISCPKCGASLDRWPSELGPGWCPNNCMTLKWFTQEEVAGLIEPLPEMLDEARNELGQPIVLTFTTGGQHCGNSAHYKGLAVDIGLGHLAEGFERDTYRWGLYKALFNVGFRRIEFAPLHAHVDIAQPPDYPSPIFWPGQDT